MKTFVRRRKKGEAKFKPNRDFISNAVNTFLINGGKITRVEVDEKSFNNFMAGTESPSSVDEFLLE